MPMHALDLPFAPFILYGKLGMTGAAQDLWNICGSMRRYCLVVVRNGLVRWHWQQVQQRLTAPTCLLIPPRSGCSIELDQASAADWMVFDLVYQERTPASKSEARVPSPLGCQPSLEEVFGCRLPIILPEELWPLTCRASARMQRQWWVSPLDHLRANQVLAGWLLDVVEHSVRSTPLTIDPLQTAIDWALQHLDRADVASMAEVAGMSRPRFCAVFRQQRKQVPGDFLDHQRVLAAVRRMERGERPLVKVAKAVGWQKVETLHRRARQLMGIELEDLCQRKDRH